MRRISVTWILILLLLVMNSACSRNETKPKEQDLNALKSKSETRLGTPAKKVILIVADSLMSRSVEKGAADNKLPAFQFLMKHGRYYNDVVSSFPTMSVTIDSTLLTGEYPDGHHVPGLTWYSAQERKVVNYGTGPTEILRQGMNQVLANALIHLNSSHLNPNTPTIYEQLAKRGRTTGSINGLIYRGNADHTLSIPKWLDWPSSLPAEIKVKGPDFMAFGALSNPMTDRLQLPVGPTQKLGFNDDYAVKVLNELIRSDSLPDFMYVYLPDLDQKLHRNGPDEFEGVVKTDRQLQSILQAFGSPEEALKKAVIIIVGDSGVSQILPSRDNPVVDLPKLLQNYEVLRTGETVTEQTDIVLAVNETMSYVYKLHTEDRFEAIADVLKTEPRLDLIAWKEGEWVKVVQAGTSKELKFSAAGPIKDRYRQSWTVEGDHQVLDLRVDTAAHRVDYDRYPDGLRRLWGALHSHKSDYLVVTVKPGYEMTDLSSPNHKGGGGHGSLERTESLVPLLIAGTDRQPAYLRLKDLQPYLIRLLSER
ncbi:alkaline phosphatase family protein [Paenibacillus spongiae]|uniref:Alkaline phosphatase family protein n=1 Tax=Paenibacillus spongiae TaxID=2909671 RepID=A0ABY5S7S5_9BACL|nr:alkaline phosphatase family protein [Paenibacillus spongiae]UVI29573.1 alkaline phosphatase family protein [Paenibacillus spongiae]